MITLAVAAAFAVLASQLSDFTGGEDGRTFKVPELLQPGFHLMEGEFFGRALDGKLITYYLASSTRLSAAFSRRFAKTISGPRPWDIGQSFIAHWRIASVR